MKKSPLVLLAPLFLGVTTSLFAFPMERGPSEGEENHLHGMRMSSAAEEEMHQRAATEDLASEKEITPAQATEGLPLPPEASLPTSISVEHLSLSVEPELKFPGDDPRRSLENPSIFSHVIETVNNTERSAVKAALVAVVPTSPGGEHPALQGLNLTEYPDAVLIDDCLKEKEEYQKIYEKHLGKIREISPDVADAIIQEDLPVTSIASEIFNQKYNELTRGYGKKQEELGFSCNQVMAIKAALNLLDIANVHRNNFLSLSQKDSDAGMADFYRKNNVNIIINRNKDTASQILEISKRLDEQAEWTEDVMSREFNTNAEKESACKKLRNASQIFQQFISASIEYGEAVRTANAESTEYFKKAVDCYSHGLLAVVDDDANLNMELYHRLAVSCSKAGKAITTGNRSALRFFLEAKTLYEQTLDAFNLNNLVYQQNSKDWLKIANCYYDTGLATLADNKPLVDLCLKATFFYKKAHQARIDGAPVLRFRFNRTADLYSNALVDMKAGNQAASGYYAQAANCYAEILKTNKNDDDPLVKPRIKAAKIFVEAAETMATGNIRQAGLLAEKANNLLIRFHAPTNPKAK